MMEIVGLQILTGLNTARSALGGAGTQTAGLAFGGNMDSLQEQQKNMMEQVGQLNPGSLNTARSRI
jgi:hypothetical protein